MRLLRVDEGHLEPGGPGVKRSGMSDAAHARAGRGRPLLPRRASGKETRMRILHTMLRVGDLDRSIAFYRDVLGMQLISRKDYPEGRFTLAFLGYGRNPEQAEIELTHNWGVEKYELGTAYGHIAVGVSDI